MTTDIIQHQHVLNALTPQGLLDYGEEMLAASILCEDEHQAQQYSDAYDKARERYNSLPYVPEVW